MKHVARFARIGSVVLTVFFALSCSPRTASKPEDKGAFLAYIEGSVTIDGKSAAIGDSVPDGSIVATDIGLAEIVFNGKNIIRLGPGTSVVLTVSTLDRTLVVREGTVTAVLRKLDKLSGGGLKVQTPSVVAGVRGTSFFLRVRPEISETYFCTCNGKLDLAAFDGSSSAEVEANHHTASIYTANSGSVTVSRPGPGYDHGHGDEDLESLAEKIGEKMDWTKVE